MSSGGYTVSSGFASGYNHNEPVAARFSKGLPNRLYDYTLNRGIRGSPLPPPRRDRLRGPTRGAPRAPLLAVLLIGITVGGWTMERKGTKLQRCPKCNALISGISPDICTSCWQDLPRARTDALNAPTIPIDTIAGTLLYLTHEDELVPYALPPASLLVTQPETRRAELLAEAEEFVRRRRYTIEAVSYPKGHCRLFEWRLLPEGEAKGGWLPPREQFLSAGLRPIVAAPVGPSVPVSRQRLLRHCLPPDVDYRRIPKPTQRRGRRWRQIEMTAAQWELDRDRYFRLKALAMSLRAGPEATKAWKLADDARAEIRRKYGRTTRKCSMCQNFLPAKSRARYCKPACKERAKKTAGISPR